MATSAPTQQRGDHEYIMVRCTPKEKKQYRALARREGYHQVSPFIRKMLNDQLERVPGANGR